MPHALRQLEFHAAPGSWRLFDARPDHDLAEVVESYWEVEGQTMSFQEKVLPAGFVELMFNLGPSHRLLTDGLGIICNTSWVSGLQAKPLHIESLFGTHLVSVRLHAPGAARILGSLEHTGNAIVELESLIGGRAGALRERLLEANSARARFVILERFLRQLLKRSRPTPEYVRGVMQQIESAHGAIRISTVCAQIGVSRKHLSTLFTRHVGISAKTFARIKRFSNAVAMIERRETVHWSRLAYATGYADQSHLVREFQELAAASPTEFLRTRTPDNSALLIDHR
jgi:AraC-like DNA-binding protein